MRGNRYEFVRASNHYESTIMPAAKEPQGSGIAEQAAAARQLCRVTRQDCRKTIEGTCGWAIIVMKNGRSRTAQELFA